MDNTEYLKEYSRKFKSEISRPAQGILRYPYLSAGSKAYPILIDWDAIWSGSFYLIEGDPEPLKNSLLNILDHIGPDGKGFRRIEHNRYSALPYQIRPFLATGCAMLSKEIGVDWLSDEYANRLDKYLKYWHIHRKGRLGLAKWLHVDEGFADNGLANWAWEENCVEAVDLNAQLVLEHINTAWIFNKKGDSQRDEWHRDKAAYLSQVIENSLWNESQSSYFSMYNPPERNVNSIPIPVIHYTNLWPLWVGIAPQERADRVIREHLLNEDELMASFGVRSMSRKERFFNNMRNGYINPMASSPQKGPVIHSGSSNWQGPVWAPCTYIGITSLAKYGYKKEAYDLAERHLQFCVKKIKEDGCYYENYHSETGEGLAAPTNGSWAILMPYVLDHIEKPFFTSVMDSIRIGE